MTKLKRSDFIKFPEKKKCNNKAFGESNCTEMGLKYTRCHNCVTNQALADLRKLNEGEVDIESNQG